MFTGIVEEVGTIVGIQKGAKSVRLTIEGKVVTTDSAVGDSIAVNGVCLTATSIQGSHFTADVMAESMRRTSFGSLTIGSKVNLERAMQANGRFGGHIVSGHIDGCGVIQELQREDNAIWVSIRADASILKYIIEKGSVAIDGISLTVAYVDSQIFKVSIIPHTQSATTLTSKKPGDVVNLENDVIGKYVDKLLHFDQVQETTGRKSEGISQSFLVEHGFI